MKIHILLSFILALDVLIVMVTGGGLYYTIYKIKKKNFKLIRRDYGLLGMYFTYFAYSLLDFISDIAIYAPMHDDFNNEVYIWLLVKRVVLTLFTGLAIAWSSGYKFGGNEKSGI